MHLQERMQDAGWQPDTVKWDGDEDSDAEDDWIADENAGTPNQSACEYLYRALCLTPGCQTYRQ
eukprot:scaffold145869_cov30-Tisochrysis_lutea.AAC.1